MLSVTHMETIFTTAQEATAALAEWRQITAWMQVAKTREPELRNKLAKHFLADKLDAAGNFPEGTTKALVGSHNVKVVGKITRTVLEELEATTLKKAALGAEGVGLIVRKPEISVAIYKKLPLEKRLIVDEMLVVKPGLPVLTVEDL